MTTKPTTSELTTADLKEAWVDAVAMAEQDLIDAAWNFIDVLRLDGEAITLTKTNDTIRIALAETVRAPNDQLTTGVPDDSKIS